ncbi:MAG: leucine-rich repeat protein [Bacteroidales bacterium]|nr:leucine-rich repeat protein [Bacteroidales bacterium]
MKQRIFSLIVALIGFAMFCGAQLTFNLPYNEYGPNYQQKYDDLFNAKGSKPTSNNVFTIHMKGKSPKYKSGPLTFGVLDSYYDWKEIASSFTIETEGGTEFSFTKTLKLSSSAKGQVQLYISHRSASSIEASEYFVLYGSPDNIIGIGRYYSLLVTTYMVPKTVTSIGDYAFSGCKSLESVTIPDNVTSIGDYAFYCCRNLTSVTIGGLVTTIPANVFDGCDSLKSVTIGKSVTTIPKNPFVDCSGLANITVESGNTKFCSVDGVLYNKDTTTLIRVPRGIKSVTIPKTVTSIGDYAFYGCNSLESVTIPDNVTSIGDYAFYGCSNLTNVTIPDNVTSIGKYAFYGCNSLNSVTIGESVTSIGYYAFDGCSSLESVTIPDNVTSIGGYAFYGCDSLNSVTIGKSVTSIGIFAFYGCSNLDTIVWNAADLRQTQWFDKSRLKAFLLGPDVEVIPEGLLKNMTNNTELTELYLPKIKTIGANAFNGGAPRLAKVYLGPDIQSIGDSAFAQTTKLTRVTCMAKDVPVVNENAFHNYLGYLYIPCEVKEDYEMDPTFSKFGHIECQNSEEIELDEDAVYVEAGETEAYFSWPKNSTAKSYSLAISKEGETFCTLVFNAQGQLASIDFGSLKAGYAGFQFNVTGLSRASIYDYVLDAKSATGKVLKSYIGKFATEGAELPEEPSEPQNPDVSIDETFTVSLSVNNASFGSVMGEGSYKKGAMATLIAIPANGYKFEKWNDGNTENPRVVTVSEKASFVATFAEASGEAGSSCTVTIVSSNNSLGTVVGGGSFEVGATATLVAVPAKGCQFVQWNDGNTENPRIVTITETMFLVASFEKIATAVETVELANEITIQNRQILVNGEAPAFVFTTVGQKIANKNLQSGVYFVQVAGKMQSVAIR